MGGGASAAAGCGCCASRCGGQPHQVVSIADDAPPCAAKDAWQQGGLDNWEDTSVPDWLATLAPGLAAEEAALVAAEWARHAEDLRLQTRSFVSRALGGVPCRIVDQISGRCDPAKYFLNAEAASLTAQELAPPPPGSHREPRACPLAQVRNIWVCSDSALARRFHGGVRSDPEADLSCLVLLDVPSGPVGLVVRGCEAREDFLDCMAVLIATQRLGEEPGLARCDLPGGVPPPEARLRPPGRSLQSAHLSGPICAWLAKIGEGLLTLESAFESQPEGADGPRAHPVLPPFAGAGVYPSRAVSEELEVAAPGSWVPAKEGCWSGDAPAPL